MKDWLVKRRWRVISAGILMVAVPLVCLSVMVNFQVTAALEDRLDKETQWLSLTGSRHIDMSLAGNVNLGKLFVTRPLLLDAIRRGDRDTLTRHLKILIDTVPELERAFIATDKGIQTACYPVTPSTLGVNFSDRDWYKGVSRNWTPYISEFYIRAAEPKRYLFAIAVPIRIEGSVMAVLVMQPKPDYIKNILNSIEIGRGRVYAVDRKGHLIYHPDYVMDRIVDFSEVPAVRSVMLGKSGVLKSMDLERKDRYYSSFSPIKEVGWGVIVEKPELIILEPIRNITVWIIGITGLMLVLGGFLAYRGAILLVESDRLSEKLREDEQVEKAYNEILTLLNNQWASLPDICSAALTRMVEQSCAEAGVLYLIDDHGLSSCASVSIPMPKAADSLALECLKQKKILSISEIPYDRHIEMNTGVGNLKPKDIIVLPLLYKDAPVGVIELACIHGFAGRDMRMFEHVSPQLAIGINTIKSQIALRNLSDELSCANEELQSMNEELQTMNEELQNQQQDLAEANTKIQEVSKAKSDFLANMSHELRTPLNSVIGFSEVLQDQLFGPLNDKQAEYVSDILGSGRHLLNLINDILDLSKVEAGKIELEPGRFQLRIVLDAAMSLFREKAMKHNLKMSLELAPEADIEIEADERKLKQILFNLLSNAVKFTPDGGSISLHARPADRAEAPSVMEGRNLVEISVTDTGIGIKEEDIPRLFHEFTQLESAYTKKFEGTGLGLALTKRLVELHGGTIHAESEIGKGSRFRFMIPASQEQQASQPAVTETAATAETTARTKKAVVIEDDPKALSMIEGSLKSAGYHVLTSMTGADGLGVVQRDIPDLVVLDLMMPGMDGFQVVEAIRSDRSTASVPIVVLTAMDLSAGDRQRLMSRVSAVVEKGHITMDKFIAIVKNAATGGKSRAQEDPYSRG